MIANEMMVRNQHKYCNAMSVKSMVVRGSGGMKRVNHRCLRARVNAWYQRDSGEGEVNRVKGLQKVLGRTLYYTVSASAEVSQLQDFNFWYVLSHFETHKKMEVIWIY